MLSPNKQPKTPKTPEAGDAVTALRTTRTPRTQRTSRSTTRNKKKKGKKEKSRSQTREKTALPVEPEPEEKPEAEPSWQPRVSIPDYENIAVTESLTSLQANFHQCVEYLSKEEGLKNYTSEFVQLYKAVIEAHFTKAELAKTMEEQNAKIAAMEAHIAELTASLKTETDSAAFLKSEVERLKKECDASHQRELDAQETICNLRNAVDAFRAERVQLGAVEATEEMIDFERMKKKMLAERQNLFDEISRLKKNLASMYDAQEELQRKNSAVNMQLTTANDKLQVSSNEVQREQRLKEKLEDELEAAVADRDQKADDVAQLNMALKTASKTISTLEQTVRDLRCAQDALMKENDTLTGRVRDATRVNDNLRGTLDHMRQEAREKGAELKIQGQAIHKLSQELRRNEAAVNRLVRSLGVESFKQKQLQGQCERATTDKDMCDRELERLRKDSEERQKEIADLKKSKDILRQQVMRGEENAKKCQDKLTLNESLKRLLEEEVTQSTSESAKQRRIILQLELERDKLTGEREDLKTVVVQIGEENLQLKGDIRSCKKELSELERKLQLQINSYEQVRMMRNQYEQKCAETSENLASMKQQLRVLNAMNDQVKETATSHEYEATRLSHSLAKADQEKACMSREMNDLVNKIRDLSAKLTSAEKAEAALKKSVRSLEDERAQLQRLVRDAHDEKDIIGTQLVRRNDEVRLLYEKIKVLQQVLASAESEYLKRTEDIRLFKIEVLKLRREKELLKRDVATTANVRRELFQLTRALTTEQQRRAALEDEMQTPINVHRWRRLECRDPAALELTQKVSILQKRILNQHRVLLDKEHRVRSAEKLYLNLRAAMVKLPGPEVLIRLRRAESAVEERGRKMKSLVAELSMVEAEAQGSRLDLNRTREELADVKSMYTTAKKKLNVAQRRLCSFPVADSDLCSLSDAVSLPTIGVKSTTSSVNRSVKIKT